MTTATHPPRRIEDVCPPWCAGHTGRYQGWETLSEGRQIRDHAEECRSAGKASVSLVQVESEDHSLSAPIVAVYIDSPGAADNADLTAAQARELAALLVDAAERAEARA